MIEAAPFGMPFVGHVWAFLWNPDSFLRYSRYVSEGQKVEGKN